MRRIQAVDPDTGKKTVLTARQVLHHYADQTCKGYIKENAASGRLTSDAWRIGGAEWRELVREDNAVDEFLVYWTSEHMHKGHQVELMEDQCTVGCG